MLFCLIVIAVAWLQMAITKNAGSGAHHVVLLWPLPQWFLAVALVEAAAWRPLQWKNAGTMLLAAAVLFLAGRKSAADQRILLSIGGLWADQELERRHLSALGRSSPHPSRRIWWWMTGEF